MSVPVPHLPRWIPWAAFAGWLVGLLIATALRTGPDRPGYWATFFADLVSTLAGLAFALTGGAALLSRWEHRRLLAETAETTVIELNLTLTRLQQLIEELLATLQSVIPLVEHAGPDLLAWLLCPPVNEDARALIDEATVMSRARDPHPSPERLPTDQHVRGSSANESRLEVDEKAELADKWWRAKMSAFHLAEYDDSDESGVKMIGQGGPHWRSAVQLVELMGARAASLETPALPSARALSRDARRLQAICDDAAEGPLAPLTVSADEHAVNLLLAVHAVWEVLKGALAVGDDLAAVRAEMATSLEDDEDPFGPRSALRRLDDYVTGWQRGAEVFVAGGLASEYERHRAGS